MFEHIFHSVHALYIDLAKLETNSIILVILLCVTVIVFDSIALSIGKIRKDLGLKKTTRHVGSNKGLKVGQKEYISEELGLAGRPDAVIEENGFFIPVERKPLQKKIHERQVAQLMVYMRLIEYCEGKRPPYGYLILGSNCKQIKIENTEEKQKWLDSIIFKMREGFETKIVQATPHRTKCSKCPVKQRCTKRFWDESIIDKSIN